MNLVIIIHSMAGGGAERVTADLANYWERKGWEISIVTLASRSLDFYELHPSVKRIDLGFVGNSGNVLVGLWQNLRRLFAIRRVLRQIQPDIALGMMASANVLLALATLGLPTLRTIGAEHIHSPEFPLGYLWETLRSYTYRLLNAVTVLTSDTEDWIKNNTNARKISVIPNAVSYPLLIQEPRIIPKASERKTLLAVGRLDKQKGFDLLIEAFFNLSAKYPNWDLVILGEGSLRPALEKQIRDLGLEKRIFLPGLVGNVGEWYETADLYIMSSRFEGFSNTLVEAMAYGLPVVSFDCDTGPRYIIRHEVDGLLVPVGDVVALAAAIDRLMSDKELRMRVSTHALEVRERFSMEKIAGLWEQLFKEIS